MEEIEDSYYEIVKETTLYQNAINDENKRVTRSFSAKKIDENLKKLGGKQKKA